MLGLTEVCAGYGKIEVLDNLTMRIDSGEIVTLLGLNGAGKTTTIRTIAGLVPARSGRVVLDGKDITSWSVRQRVLGGISVVPEGRSLFTSMSVDENLEIGAFTRRDHAAVRADHDRLLEAFPDLSKTRHRLAGQLSGGQQSIAAFARGLMAQPSVMLLDEPSLGVAPKVLEHIGEAIKATRTRLGISCLLVEQDIPFALSVADRVLVLSGGRVALEGTPQEIEGSRELQDLFFGRSAQD
jgi:branched-chain amino acid transport system ATP-binding protein